MKRVFFLLTIIVFHTQLISQPIYEMNVNPSTTKKVMWYLDSDGEGYGNGTNFIGVSYSSILLREFHSAFKFSIPTLPDNSDLVSCRIEAEVTNYYGEESTAIIKLLSDGSIPSSAEDAYNMVEGGSDIFTFDYDETGSYDITNTYSSKINQGYINLGAMANSEGYGISNHADITIKLIVEYHRKYSIDIAYNFSGNGIEVKAGVDESATTKASPYEALAYRGQTVNIEAIEDQTDNNGYVRIWNDTEAPILPSVWIRTNQIGSDPKSSNQQYSFTVTSEDSNSTWTGYLRKKCSITFQNNLPGYGSGGVIKVNSTQVNSPSTGNTVIELNAITGEPISQLINGIFYTFKDWSTGSTTYSQTFYPEYTTSYTANYNARPTNTYRSLGFNDGDIGEDIEVRWNAHQLDNNGITKYDIYRKIKYNGVMGAECKIGTRYANGSATYSFIDNSYQVADGTTIRNNFYDVRAYYQPSATYANPEFVSIYADCLQNYQNSNTGTDAADAVMTPSAEEEVTPTETTLGNYPNPFNPNTVINYQLSVDSKVVLKVYDMLGKEVATLVNDTKPAGSYNVSFNGSNLPSGVYIYMLQTNSQAITKKMLLMK